MERRHREPSCVGNRFAACVVRNVAHFRSVWAIRLQHLFAFDCRKADFCVACAVRLHEAGGCGVAGSSRRSAPRRPRDSRGPGAARVPVTAGPRQNEGQYQGPRRFPRRFPPQYSTLLRRFPRVGKCLKPKQTPCFCESDGIFDRHAACRPGTVICICTCECCARRCAPEK